MKIYEEELKKYFSKSKKSEVAKILNISESALSRLLCGSRRLGIIVAKKLVRAVGIDMANSLINWEGLPCLRT